MSIYTYANGKPIDLPEILSDHLLWLETDGEKGVRADLAGANLAGADLVGANLVGANLAGADLVGANLARANLAGAGGCVMLTETDHGFRVVAGFRGGVWRIWAGCRDFTIARAREHWGAANYHTPRSGRRVVACLDWLEREIANGLTIEVPK